MPRSVIAYWKIALVCVLLLLSTAPTFANNPVSYTHLTLPTTERV